MGARQAKYENPGIAASFFYCLKKTMFGENQDVPLEEMGEQKEWNAKRAVLVTRNLQAIEGTRTEQLPSARRQETRFAYPREPVDTVQGERERERDQAESPRGPEMTTLVKEKAPGRKVRD